MIPWPAADNPYRHHPSGPDTERGARPRPALPWRHKSPAVSEHYP